MVAVLSARLNKNEDWFRVLFTYRSILLDLPGIDPVYRTHAVWGRERLAWLECDEFLDFSQVRVAEMLRI